MSKDYSKMTIEALAIELQTETDENKKLKIMTAMNSHIRVQRTEITDKLKAEKEDTDRQKKLLAESKKLLIETRNEFMTAFRELNELIKERKKGSMLKNFQEFEFKSAAFIGKSEAFKEAIEAHTIKLNEVKNDT